MRVATWIVSVGVLTAMACVGSQQPDAGPADLKAILALDKPQRIAALIKDLDKVYSVGVSSPGGAYFLSDPICKALADQGDDAVPALIDVIESDKRLTKVVAPGRVLGAPSHIYPVKSAAWQILLTIWPSACAVAEGGIVPVPPAPSATALRDAWAKESKETEPERWLNVLEDDSADWRFWVQAAGFLVKPANETWIGGGFMRSGKPGGGLTGESLRPSHDSEVAAILSRRALEMSSKDTRSSLDAFYCGDALRIAHCLFKWDRTLSLPVLRQTCANCLKGQERYGSYANPQQTVVGPFGIVIADRVALGDSSAAADYAAMAPNAEFSFGWFPTGFLNPLWAEPRDAGIEAEGTRLFQKLADQIASPDPGKAFQGTQTAAELPSKSLILAFRPYRDLLIKTIKDDRKVIEGKVDAIGTYKGVAYRFEGGGAGSLTLDSEESKKVPAGGSVSLSVGDALAFRLTHSFLKGFPAFSFVASNSDRRRAKKRLITFLDNNRFDWLEFSRTSPLANIED